MESFLLFFSFIDWLFPSKWLKIFNQILKGHADSVLLRIQDDVKEEILKLWDIRDRLATGILGVCLPFLGVAVIELLKPVSLTPATSGTLFISSCLVLCVGVLLLLPILSFAMLLSYATPLYLFFWVISKSRSGALAGYVFGISLAVFAIRQMSIVS